MLAMTVAVTAGIVVGVGLTVWVVWRRLLRALNEGGWIVCEL